MPVVGQLYLPTGTADTKGYSCTAQFTLSAFQFNGRGCDKLCLHYKVVGTASAALGEILQCEAAGSKDPHTQYARFRVVGFFCFGLALLQSRRLNVHLEQQYIRCTLGVQLPIWFHPR